MRKTALVITALLFTLALLNPAQAADRPSWWADAANKAKADGYRLADHDDLVRLKNSAGDPLLLDVRAAYEFKADHIPGGANMEFDLADEQRLNPTKQRALRLLAGPDRERIVIIYCRSFR